MEEFILIKEELWDNKDIVSNPQFEIELGQLFDIDKQKMVSVGQAVKLYDYLGEEIQNEDKENMTWIIQI